jgi:hypothetical protein
MYILNMIGFNAIKTTELLIYPQTSVTTSPVPEICAVFI